MGGECESQEEKRNEKKREEERKWRREEIKMAEEENMELTSCY